MLDDRKILYISRGQRIAISVGLLCFAGLSGLLIYVAATVSKYDHLLTPGVELVKLFLTALGVWGLIDLYASANSPHRIEKEAERFYKEDVMRAFGQNTFFDKRFADGAGVSLIRNSAGSALFQVRVKNAEALHLWCYLNANKLEVIFLLEAGFADTYQSVYGVTLKGFASQGLELGLYGVNSHDADGALNEARKFLELYVVRELPGDFLFDAASRYATARAICGDVRSFVNETERFYAGKSERA